MPPKKLSLTYTRPGVAAAARLASLTSNVTDATAWEDAHGRYEEMLIEKGGDKLNELDSFCRGLSERLRCVPSSSSSPDLMISKEELLKVVEWKFAKGKPRWALINLLKSNSPNSVKECSACAFEKSREGDISGAINSLCELKGVGPATASALLNLHRDDLFAFMDDEVIECLYDGKRGYTLKIYLDVNAKCSKIAENLGGAWTPGRVGRALWTAARLSATGRDDPTREVEESSDAPVAPTRRIRRAGDNSVDRSSKPERASLSPKRRRKS